MTGVIDLIGGGSGSDPLLECVVNVSEGRDQAVIDDLAEAAGVDLLDVHSDPHHNRSVFTLIGTGAVRRLARVAVSRLDISTHHGVHPRLGVVDVVPFVPLAGCTMDDALRARDDFATWAAGELGVPCFLYGPERSLPTVRRDAWQHLSPDIGPATAHPRAGSMCVGARAILIAYNVWLAPGSSLADARRIAGAVRSPAVRALGLPVGDRMQVSMNLVQPFTVGPADAYDAVAALRPTAGAELVGLLPDAILRRVTPNRWPSLDLAPERTIEWRLAHRVSASR